MEISKKPKQKPKKGLPKSCSKKMSHNGKGDSPRSLSPRFRNNYEKINWKKA
tara:strand:- start:157 stop:312 length:156 start_codon:yes stop_codon:yes gene_type:complete